MTSFLRDAGAAMSGAVWGSPGNALSSRQSVFDYEPFTSPEQVQQRNGDPALELKDVVGTDTQGCVDFNLDPEEEVTRMEMLRELAISKFWYLAVAMGLALGLTAGAYLQLLEEVFDENEQHEALFLGGSHALTALANIASKSLYGPWSDKHGRRGLLVLNSLSNAISLACLGLAPNVYSLAAVVLFSALTSTSFLLRVVVMDIMPDHSHTNITKKMGVFSALLGVCVGVTFPVALVAPQWVGFFVGSLICLFQVYWLIWQMPETLPLGKFMSEPKHEISEAGGTTHVVHVHQHGAVEYNPVKLLRILDATKTTRWLAIAWVFRECMLAGLQSVFIPYVHERFDWGSTEQGAVFIGIAVTAIISNLGISFLIKRMGSGFLILGGNASIIVCAIILSVSFYPWIMIMGISMLFPLGFTWPTAVLGVIASELPQNRQGHLQGAIDSLLSLASALGSATMVATFFILIWDDETGTYLPEGTFYLATLFAVASWGFSTLAVYHAGNDKLALEEMSSIVKPVDTLQVMKMYETKQYHHSNYPG